MKQNIYYLKRSFVLGTILAFVSTSCSVSPQPIAYGQESCYYCRMTIVDKIHGAEIITGKGKVFKFDAVECLINHTKEISPDEGFQYLTNHYNKPGEFVAASQAVYLYSENLPSPMGAFITAFKDEASAREILAENGGKLLNWEELHAHLLQ